MTHDGSIKAVLSASVHNSLNKRNTLARESKEKILPTECLAIWGRGTYFANEKLFMDMQSVRALNLL